MMANSTKTSKRYTIIGLCLFLPWLADWLLRLVLSGAFGGSFNIGGVGFQVSQASGVFPEWFSAISPATQSAYFLVGSFYLVALVSLTYIVFFRHRQKSTFPWSFLLMGGVLALLANGLMQNTITYLINIFGFRTNIAFLCVLVALLGILVSYFKTKPELKDSRKQLFILQDQYHFCLSIGLTYIIFIIAIGVFSYIFIANILSTVAITMQGMSQSQIIDTMARYSNFYFFLFMVLASFLAIVCSLFVIYLSNKIYGPIYAFQKYLKSVVIDKKQPERGRFTLRKNDHFKFLEDFMRELLKKINK